jgi:hypothetical protein
MCTCSLLGHHALPGTSRPAQHLRQYSGLLATHSGVCGHHQKPRCFNIKSTSRKVTCAPFILYQFVRQCKIRAVPTHKCVQSHWHQSYKRACSSPCLCSSGVPFIVSPSMAALSHRNPAYIPVYRGSNRTQGHDKRYICISLHVYSAFTSNSCRGE